MLADIRTPDAAGDQHYRRLTITLTDAAARDLDELARVNLRNPRTEALRLLILAIARELELHRAVSEPPDPGEPRSAAPRRRATAARELKAAGTGRAGS